MTYSVNQFHNPEIVMSLELALAENTAVNAALTEVLKQVVGNQERLLAGQIAAIDKIDGVKSGGRAGKKETPAPVAETPVAPPTVAETPAAPAAPAAPAPVVTDDQIKAAAHAWMTDKSEADRLAAAKFLGEIMTSFGVGGKLTGPESKLDDEQRRQALFFIQRKAAGLEVNFSADYDFTGDPTQGAAAAGDDLLG